MNCKTHNGLLFIYCFPAVWMVKAALLYLSLFQVIIQFQPWNVLDGSSSFFYTLRDPSTFQAKTSVDQLVQSEVATEHSLVQGLFQVTLACGHRVVDATFHCEEGCLVEKRHPVDTFPSNTLGMGLCFSNILSFKQPASVQHAVVVCKLKET